MTLSQSQFTDDNLNDLYRNGAPRDANPIPKNQQRRIVRLLDALASSSQPEDLNVPGFGFVKVGAAYQLKIDNNNNISFNWQDNNPLDISYV